MKLSIIIPCYNASDNIEGLINNLAKQLTQEVEVIIVDDGSTDSSLNIIKSSIGKYEHLQEQFRIISRSNSGAAISRTVGLNYAKGEFVFFCDSDDRVSSRFIPTILSSIESSIDIIYFSSCITDESFNPTSSKIRVEDDCYIDGEKDIFSYLLNNCGYTAAVWSYVFRRSLSISSNAAFTNRKVHEDHLFTLSILGSAKKASFIKDVLYYQQHGNGSLTRSEKDFLYIKERYLAYKETRNFVSNKFGLSNLKKYDDWSLESFLYLSYQNKRLLLNFKNLAYVSLCLVNHAPSTLRVFSKYLSRKVKI